MGRREEGSVFLRNLQFYWSSTLSTPKLAKTFRPNPKRNVCSVCPLTAMFTLTLPSFLLSPVTAMNSAEMRISKTYLRSFQPGRRLPLRHCDCCLYPECYQPQSSSESYALLNMYILKYQNTNTTTKLIKANQCAGEAHGARSVYKLPTKTRGRSENQNYISQ